jgi:hypothetical protein
MPKSGPTMGKILAWFLNNTAKARPWSLNTTIKVKRWVGDNNWTNNEPTNGQNHEGNLIFIFFLLILE